MRQIPMLFSPAMIEALLAGRKTETRRILKPQPDPCVVGGASFIEGDEAHPLGRWVWRNGHDGSIVGDHMGHRTRPGDLIWVKETHFAYGYWRPLRGELTKTGKPKRKFVRYPAESVRFDCPKGGPCTNANDHQTGWYKRPSLFMERADSRLTLRVTNFNIEMLCRITHDEAVREGIERQTFDGQWRDYGGGTIGYNHPRDSYASLWDAINGDGSWAKDPWVEATRFEVVRQNVLQVAA